jgi:hypothetical protein
MTCENCIHYGLCIDCICYECSSGGNNCNDCEIYSYRDGQVTELTPCEDFKDKSKIIELPCKVGDTVYAVFDESYALDESKWNIEQHIVLGGNSKHLFIYQDDEIRTLRKNDIGRLLFLTKEEAEAKLKELNKNGY